MGESIAADIELEVEIVREGQSVDSVLGLGWELSEAAKTDLREIDANIRAAELKSGTLIIG